MEHEEAAARRWIRDHGLLLANAGLFLVFFVGMVLAGVRAYNGDQSAHHEPAVSLWGYLHTGDFVEATFENWESEFLQMGMYVVLTAFLFQRGSSESKPIDQPSPQDQDPRDADKRADVPRPVRRGGIALALYERSLAGLFFVLFALSIALHAAGGARAYSDEQLAHGQPAVSFWSYVGTSQFWFESFQNWQSEFLAVAVIVGASVYLRQRGSAESKPVAEPHHTTGAPEPALPDDGSRRAGTLQPMITGRSPQVLRPAPCVSHAAAMTSMVVIWYRVRHSARRGRCPCWICAD